MCVRGNNFKDVQSCSRRKEIGVASCFALSITYVELTNEYPNEMFEIQCMTFNSFTFEHDQVSAYNSLLYKIVMILKIDSEIYFAVKELEFLGLDDFTQSIMIKWTLNEDLSLIKFDNIEHKKSYPIKSIEDKNFVIIDDLELMYDF